LSKRPAAPQRAKAHSSNPRSGRGRAHSARAPKETTIGATDAPCAGLVVGRRGPVYTVRQLKGPPPPDPAELAAAAVARLRAEGREPTLELPEPAPIDPHRAPCIARGAGKRAVVGDVVGFHWELNDLACGLITEVAERRNALVRADALNRGPQTLAANLDRVWVVCATEPPPKRGLIDRYLVAAHARGISAGVIFNKCDLLRDDEEREDAEDVLLPYEILDHPTFMVSAETGVGLDALREALRDERSVFVGHSGVGKTSLLNALIPSLNEAVGAISEATGKGQHTTTTSTLYELEGGGEIIDSPGIRGFGLWGMEPRELKEHFPEFNEFAPRCRFYNCLHVDEPTCAVRDAVEADELSFDRYEAYLKIFEDLEDLKG
jgi:ribosome biogenesis GTPase